MKNKLNFEISFKTKYIHYLSSNLQKFEKITINHDVNIKVILEILKYLCISMRR